jgi:hypothetical protein
LGDIGADERIVLKWTGVIWLRIGSNGGLF